MFRFPFASNRWFRLLLSLAALAAIVKMLLQEGAKSPIHYFIIAVAGALAFRGGYLFFRPGADKSEDN